MPLPRRGDSESLDSSPRPTSGSPHRRILFIGPLPDPITGQSLACQVLLDHLRVNHRVDVVNLSKETFEPGVTSLRRILEIVKVLLAIWRKQRRQNTIYLTPSQSLAGNLKDLCIYLICAGRLSSLYIHLHGGSIRRALWQRHPYLYWLNRFFIRRMAGVLVTGESHRQIFDGMISPTRVFVVPNFAQDYLFRDDSEIEGKFHSMVPLKVLYLSNFIRQKGFNELLEAYWLLTPAAQRAVTIDFAGRFESPDEERLFVPRLQGRPNLRYHGPVYDAAKGQLFADAHVFCLPTMFLEGQPVSILEAYASGCVVVTTGLGGIRDVFADGVNGFEVESQSAASIAKVIESLVAEPRQLPKMAIENARIARRQYRSAAFCFSVTAILDGLT